MIGNWINHENLLPINYNKYLKKKQIGKIKFRNLKDYNDKYSEKKYGILLQYYNEWIQVVCFRPN